MDTCTVSSPIENNTNRPTLTQPASYFLRYYDKDPVDVDEVDSENVDEESHHQQKDQETLTAGTLARYYDRDTVSNYVHQMQALPYTENSDWCNRLTN
jgi:hypothetical protein